MNFFSALRKPATSLTLGLAVLAIGAGRLQAGSIYVPNGSFELPATDFATNNVEFWEQNPPAAFLATGVFLNTGPSETNHIHNLHGQQAAFMANFPTVELSLDYTSVDYANQTHQFQPKYEVGKAYDLTVGVIGGGGGMPPGAMLRMALFYRDAASNKVVIAQRIITNSLALFPDKTNFVDFKIQLGGVQPTDAWANRHIGIQLVDASAAPSATGYWDVDNVRLESIAVGSFVHVPNGSFELPATDFATNTVDYWEQNPPAAFLATGVFLNTGPTETNHIHNIDGQQAAFMANFPTVELSLDYTSVDHANRTHQFDSKYEVGKAYDLTVGVIGGGGGMPPGAMFRMALYYRDALSNKVVIAQRTITNSLTLFPGKTNFVSFTLHLNGVGASDAWAGKYIGIQLLDASLAPSASGYWDVDKVQLQESIVVPNGSFELPVTDFATNTVDFWEQNPPAAFLATGVFLNTAPTETNYIHNIDGQQAAFMANYPTVELSLDYASVDHANQTQQFQSKYEVGKAYDLTVGVIGGGGGMPPGASLRMALYYRNASSNKVVIAQRTITNSLALFPDKTNFVNFTLHLDGVKPSDPWANKHIGIQLMDTSPSPSLGYWDVDKVQLGLERVPMSLNPALSSGQFRFTMNSEPGAKLQVLASTNIALPLASWTSLGTVTNVTGANVFTNAAGPSQRFYQLRLLP